MLWSSETELQAFDAILFPINKKMSGNLGTKAVEMCRFFLFQSFDAQLAVR